MIDINLQVLKKVNDEVKREHKDEEDQETSFYVERETGSIYEARLFPEFALIRLAMLDHQPPVSRIDFLTFTELFDPYEGDVKELRSLLFGSTDSRIFIEKK